MEVGQVFIRDVLLIQPLTYFELQSRSVANSSFFVITREMYVRINGHEDITMGKTSNVHPWDWQKNSYRSSRIMLPNLRFQTLSLDRYPFMMYY